MPRFLRLSAPALLLATAVSLSMPIAATAQSSMSSSYGDLVVTILGNGSVGSRNTFRGIEATFNDREVLITENSVIIDGEPHDITAESEVIIDGTEGFSVSVDGETIYRTDELADLMTRAEAGDAVAQLNLGVRYLNGEGVAADAARAAALYRLAAEQGLPEAQSNLAYLLYNGTGVDNDDAAAMRWARLAADQDNAIAMRLVGFGFYRGRGVAQDLPEAARVWAAAANLGDADSAYNVGIMDLDGEGVQQDDALAIRWFERARDLGHENAAERLAELRGE